MFYRKKQWSMHIICPCHCYCPVINIYAKLQPSLGSAIVPFLKAILKTEQIIMSIKDLSSI